MTTARSIQLKATPTPGDFGFSTLDFGLGAEFAPCDVSGSCLSSQTQNGPVHFHRASILYFTRSARGEPMARRDQLREASIPPQPARLDFRQARSLRFARLSLHLCSEQGGLP